MSIFGIFLKVEAKKILKGELLMTREQIMNDPTTHNLVKELLELCKDRDPVDVFFDVQLVCEVLREEMAEALTR